MALDFPDRRDRLFGREGDLQFLTNRTQFSGLSAVAARPQMGKSWLLKELARCLSTEQVPPHLVGFATSSGDTPDLLLRAVVDLYERWLSDAGYLEQAKMVWNQQKPNVLPGVSKAVGKIFSEIGGKVAKPVTAVVEEAIKGLIAANQTLMSGGMQLPALQYDQARDLIATVAQVGKRPIALFLDQWEKSPDPEFEAKTLDAFLHHLDEWPKCHIFMALRREELAFGVVKKLSDSLPGTAIIYPLGQMALEHGGSRERMLRYVRHNVPAAAAAEDDAILNLIDGYPGVIYQWTSDYQRAHMNSLDELIKVAADAQNYRFSELDQLLPPLDGDQRRMSIRLALVPLGEAKAWSALKEELLDGLLGDDLIDDLALAGVLEETDPPSFGHPKRLEAIRKWLVEHRKAAVRTEAESLIKRLSATIRGVDPEFALHASVLWGMVPASQELNIDGASAALCQAAATLFADFSKVDDALIRGAEKARAGEFSTAMPLLAMGLFNTLNHAKEKNDLGRRDELLEELRGLAEAHPDEAAVRERLAGGLFNTLNDAKEENDLGRRDELLGELRGLAEAHPEDAAVREPLARGLVNTVNDAKEENDLARRDELLGELRGLAEAHPEDAAVREQLARGLVNTLNDAKEENDLARRDELLEELRGLSEAHPEDAAVREQLAKGLFNTLNDAKEENDLAKRDELLGELRGLAEAHPEDAAVREQLARGLFNTLNDAKEENDLARRDELLGELRGLAEAHPEDAAVREQLARGLFNRLNDAKEENDLGRRDELLEELRGLAEAHPEDAWVSLISVTRI